MLGIGARALIESCREGAAIVTTAGGARDPSDPDLLADAQRALRESDLGLRAIFNGASDAIVITDLLGNCVDANPAAHALVRLPDGALRGVNLTSLFSPLVLEHASERGRERPVACDAPYEITLADGERLIIECTMTAEVLPGRNLWIGRDITERRRAEDALREGQRQLASLLGNLPGMAYRCANDPDWTELFVSEGCLELTGYETSDIEHNRRISYNDVIHPDDRQAVWQTTQRSIAEHTPYRFAYRIVTRSGEEKWVWDQGGGVCDADGRLLFLEGFIMDISEKVRAEEALRRSAERALQSGKLEAMGQLAGGIAHDFNNLLTVILGYSEMLLSKHEVQRLHLCDDVQQIRQNAERAAALTRQILAFSRRQPLRPETVSLNDIIAGMEPLLRRTLGEDIEIVSLQELDVGCVEVDVHQFEQVILNLSVNARDAMPAGGRLTVQTARVTLTDSLASANAEVPPGDYVSLTVSDTGTGMDAGTIEHVFEPFFTTKSVGQGTGLGLATVHGIVNQSGGHIIVESTLGQGTSFKIYLPLAQDVEDRPEQPVVAAAVAVDTQRTILVVEDDDALRSLCERVLGSLGFGVLVAADALEALAILGAEGPAVDLLLSDMVLPGGMDGYDLARAATGLNESLPILFMSGYAHVADQQHDSLPAGPPLLEKPFTAAQLASRVREALERAPARDAANR